MSTPQADYDQPLKWIAEHDPDGLLALLGQRATKRKSLSTELPATMRRPDLVWEVERPNGQTGVIHLVSLLLDIAGLRLKRADVLEVIRRHPTMNDLINESSFTEVIEELRGPKWKLAGMREMAQGVLESRFVSVPVDVLAALNAADEATLRALIPAISTESLEEVRARLGFNTN
jgi:hypothetical protein